MLQVAGAAFTDDLSITIGGVPNANPALETSPAEIDAPVAARGTITLRLIAPRGYGTVTVAVSMRGLPVVATRNTAYAPPAITSYALVNPIVSDYTSLDNNKTFTLQGANLPSCAFQPTFDCAFPDGVTGANSFVGSSIYVAGTFAPIILTTPMPLDDSSMTILSNQPSGDVALQLAGSAIRFSSPPSISYTYATFVTFQPQVR